MPTLVTSSLNDFHSAGTWIQSQAECEIWSGGRVNFPIEHEQMLEAIQWKESLNWSLLKSNELVGIGQLVKKFDQRLHLARILIRPENRGSGFGRMLVEKLVEAGFSFEPRCLSLNVHPENHQAIALYTSIGFCPVENKTENRNGLFIYMEHRR